MISTTDPESMTVDERRLEIATILACGLLRRVRQDKLRKNKVGNFSQKELEVSAKTRLSVAG